MKNAAIDSQYLDAKNLRQKVETKIDWLIGRIARLYATSEIDKVMLGIYAQKMQVQRTTLYELNKHKNQSLITHVANCLTK